MIYDKKLTCYMIQKTTFLILTKHRKPTVTFYNKKFYNKKKIYVFTLLNHHFSRNTYWYRYLIMQIK